MKQVTQIPNQVARDPRLSAKAKGIYLYLSSFPDNWTTSIRDIAEDMRDNRDSIQSGLTELIVTSYVIRVRGKKGRNKYILKLPEPPTEELPAADDKEAKKRRKRASAGQLFEAEKFDEFWKLYPRKAAKGEARKAWNQMLHAGFLPDGIIAGLGTSPRLQGHDKVFMPHPATWLRSEGWGDDPESSSQKKPWEYEK